MRKSLVKCLSFVTSIMICGAALTSCAAGASSNGGIPTEEQLSAAAEELGDDIGSLKFSADGVIYQFPVDTKAMLDAGWYFDSDVKSELKSIPANTLVAPSVSMRKNAKNGYGITSCGVQPMNRSASEVSLEETVIYSLNFYKEKGTTLILPGGITWNSTFDEVKELCGSQSAVDMEGIKYVQVNGADRDFSVQINFDSTENTVKSVEFKGRL